MIVAIPSNISDENELVVSGHFSGSKFIEMYEFDENMHQISIKVIENSVYGEHTGQCKLPGLMKRFSANVVITGGIGKRARSILEASGIKVYQSQAITNAEAIERFLKDELELCSDCEHHGDHHHHHEGHHHHHTH